MKQFFIIVVSIFFTQFLYAQTEVSYTYDDAGNRITRQVVTLPNKDNIDKSYSEDKSAEVENVFGKGNVTLYPNPTKGNLTLQFSNVEITDEILLQVYDIKGTLIKNKKTRKAKNTIDLSNNTAGTYILKIFSGEKKAEFVVIKE